MTLVLRRILPTDAASRAASLSIAVSSVLMLLKISVGLISGSVAVLSDGIDSLEDLIAASIVFASVRYGARPPDPGHPFGYGRAETMAASVQALLIGAAGIFIIVSSVRRILDPPDEIETGLALGVMAVAALANLLLARYASGVATATGSPAITSEARHLWTNVVQACAVLVGLVVVALTGVIELDGVIALLLGLYLMWIAARIIWSAAADVMDSSLSAEEIVQIDEAIRSEGEAVRGYHRLRTRRSGQVRQIDFHLQLAGEMSLALAHDTAHRIEARIKERMPRSVVVVHVEPHEGSGSGPGL